MDNLCKEVLETALDLKAENIIVIDLTQVSLMADYMMVCTGRSKAHTQGISNSILTKAKEKGFKVYSIEGINEGEWVLLDLGNIIVHSMTKEIRDHYKIEQLWNNGKVIYFDETKSEELQNA